MDYIKYIRSLIGHKPVIMVGAVVVVFNTKGAILLTKRKDNQLWCCPGGFMDLEETIEECAKREFKEEVGQAIKDLKLITVLSGQEYFYEYPNQDKVYNLTVVFNGTLLNPNPSFKTDQESEAIAWFGLDNLPPLSPPTKIMFDHYLEDLKKLARKS